MATVSIRDVRKRYGVHRGAARRQRRNRGRRIRHPGGAIRLRQIDAAADDRRAGEHHRRRDRHRRARGQRCRAEGARHRHGVPELRAVSAHDGARQHGVRAEPGERAAGGDRPEGRARGGDPEPGALPQPLSAAIVGRAAAARGDGAGDRARPAGVPVRRAAVESGRQAARGDAGGDQGTAPAADHHHGLCHARPDRGDDDGRQDRGDERRQRGADRRSVGAVRQPGELVRRGLHRLAGDEFPEGHGWMAARSGRMGARPCRCPRPAACRRAARSSTASGRSISG